MHAFVFIVWGGSREIRFCRRPT